jgi:hypothetical protein
MLAAGEAEAEARSSHKTARSQKPEAARPSQASGGQVLTELPPACCCSGWCLVLALVLAVAVSSAPQA